MKELYYFVMHNFNDYGRTFRKIKYFYNVKNVDNYQRICKSVVHLPFSRKVDHTMFFIIPRTIEKVSQLYCCCGYITGLKMLYDINDNISDNIGFCIACREGHINVVKYFLKMGTIDVNYVRFGSSTPLDAAIFNEHVAIVKLLLKNGADIHYIDNYGEFTHLMYAAKYNKKQTKIVQMLINAGANVHHKNSDGHSILEVATLYNSDNNVGREIIQMISKKLEELSL